MNGLVNPMDNAVSVLWQTLLGQKWRVRLHDPNAKLGRRCGDVLDLDGNVVGDADDYIYCGRGFAIHTQPYGGFVAEAEIIFVESDKGGVR